MKAAEDKRKRLVDQKAKADPSGDGAEEKSGDSGAKDTTSDMGDVDSGSDSEQEKDVVNGHDGYREHSMADSIELSDESDDENYGEASIAGKVEKQEDWPCGSPPISSANTEEEKWMSHSIYENDGPNDTPAVGKRKLVGDGSSSGRRGEKKARMTDMFSH